MSRCRAGSSGGGPVVGKQQGVFKERKEISRTGAECTQERLKDVVRAPGIAGPLGLASSVEVCILIEEQHKANQKCK